MLILAGVSINLVVGDNGILGQSRTSSQRYNEKQAEEKLKVELSGTTTELLERGEDSNLTNIVEEFKQDKQTVVDIIEIKYAGTSKLGPDVVVDKDQKIDYILVEVDSYVFELKEDAKGHIEIKGSGTANEIAPAVEMNITSTTNKLTAKVVTRRNQDGKIDYYIRENKENVDLEEETGYELIKEGTDEDKEFTFENLKQNVKYDIKVVATAPNGKDAVVRKSAVTIEVRGLVNGDINFNYNTNWTNQNVLVKASITNEEIAQLE